MLKTLYVNREITSPDFVSGNPQINIIMIYKNGSQDSNHMSGGRNKITSKYSLRNFVVL